MSTAAGAGKSDYRKPFLVLSPGVAALARILLEPAALIALAGA